MQDQGAAERKDAILRAVAYTAERLLAEGDWGGRVDDVLRRLGRATGADRVYVFEVADDDGQLLASQRHEWVAEGVEPQIDNPELQDLPFAEAGFARWARTLADGGAISGSVADFPDSEQALLEEQDIRSLVVVPIGLDRSWWGFMGFDATSTDRRWEPAEVDALRAAAGALGAAIGQQRLLAELRDSRQRYVEAFRREREAADRLRELDEMRNTFLDAVSHELRTPLHAILGLAETLHQHGDRLDEVQRSTFVERLLGNGRRLDQILAGLLDLNRLRRGAIDVDPRPTEVRALLDAVVTWCEALGDNEVQVECDVHTAWLDATLVERILVNLLENAVVHAGRDRRLWVRADLVADTVLRLVVEDDGPGVPEEHRDRVFEPFEHAHAKEHAPGTGMGLAIVKRFAELHGGQVSLGDRPGGGARFEVLLDVTPARTSESA